MDAEARVSEAFDRLPDDCSLADVLYHLYVLDQVDRGLADAAAGRVRSHDEVMASLRQKWLTGPAG